MKARQMLLTSPGLVLTGLDSGPGRGRAMGDAGSSLATARALELGPAPHADLRDPRPRGCSMRSWCCGLELLGLALVVTLSVAAR